MAEEPTTTQAPEAPFEGGAVELHLSRIARLGLAGRTAFYIILVGLTLRLAVLGSTGTRGDGVGQVDASGALDAVSPSVLGEAAIFAVAAGFLLFGAARLVGGARDGTVSRSRRAMTIGQGVFYLALAYVPIAFLAGAHRTGSQASEQHTVSSVLSKPAGPELLAVAGIVAVLVCAQQIRSAVARDFHDGLDLEGAHPAMHHLCNISGIVGIVSRACVFLPAGVFLIVAAVRSDPSNAYGTDAELLQLSGTAWGTAALAAVALGLAIFAVFSLLEVRYRRIVCAR